MKMKKKKKIPSSISVLEIPPKPILKQKRISGWPRIRREHLKRQPSCQVCGTKQRLSVHHIVPVWVRPEGEADPTNMITLCENPKTLFCHFTFGHMGKWKRWNKAIVDDANGFAIKIKESDNLI